MSERDHETLMRFKRLERGFKKVGLVIMLLISLVMILSSCGDTTVHSESAVVGEQTSSEPVSSQDNSETKENDKSNKTKTDNELYIETGTLIASAIYDEVQKRKEEKRLERAGRAMVAAYQIGIVMDKTNLLDTYSALLKKDLATDVYGFEESKNNYVLVRFEQEGRTNLYKMLDSLDSLFYLKTHNRIRVIDLNTFCSKGQIRKCKSLKFRKEKFEIPMLECGG